MSKIILRMFMVLNELQMIFSRALNHSDAINSIFKYHKSQLPLKLLRIFAYVCTWLAIDTLKNNTKTTFNQICIICYYTDANSFVANAYWHHVNKYFGLSTYPTRHSCVVLLNINIKLCISNAFAVTVYIITFYTAG